MGHDVEVATRNLAEVIFECFFEAIGTDLPAANRWYTFPVHLCRQAGSFFCHGLLQRVAEAVYVPPRLLPNDDDSYHAHCHKKVTSANAFVTGPQCGETLGFALVATLPIDHVSLRLQHLDAIGEGSVRDVTDMTDAGLLKRCMAKYYEIFNFMEPSPLFSAGHSLWWYLEGRMDQDTFCDMLRRFCVGLSAMAWARLEIKRLRGPN